MIGQGLTLSLRFSQMSLRWAGRVEDWLRPSSEWALFFVVLWKFTLLGLMQVLLHRR